MLIRPEIEIQADDGIVAGLEPGERVEERVEGGCGGKIGHTSRRSKIAASLLPQPPLVSNMGMARALWRPAVLAVLLPATLCAQTPTPLLTIRTRRVYDRPNSTVFTEALYVVGSRKRQDTLAEFPGAGVPRHLRARLLQCDEGRDAMIFPDSRTYVEYGRTGETGGGQVAAPRSIAPDPKAAQAPIVTVTVETTDTGERRQLGSFVARRVVTTKTISPARGAATRASAETTDGWYLDVSALCEDPRVAAPAGMLVVLGSARPGEAFDRPNLVVRGQPERGYPIELTSRRTDELGTLTSTTSLLDFSEAPIDPSLFEVPPGYRPALRLPGGGIDPTRPDSLWNRADAYTRWTARWVKRWF
jgi:hypothetical protein